MQLFLFFALTTTTYSQSLTEYVGKAVAPLTFEQAMARFPKAISPRGEYETTAQYEVRRSAVASKNSVPLIILKEPDWDHIRYDADSGRLDVSEFAFDNANFPANRAFAGTPYADVLKASPFLGYNHDVVIKASNREKGSYVGQNAFGVSCEITRYTHYVKAIFDRSTDRDETLFHGPMSGIEMPPEVARRLKPKLKLAFVVVPREPYVVQSEYKGSAPTLDAPYERTYVNTVLVGDIQYGLVLDASNKVLAAYPTRSPSILPQSPDTGGPKINHVFHSGVSTRLRAGDLVLFLVSGAHECEASFEIVGCTERIPIPEGRAGTYKTHWTVPKGLVVEDGVVRFHLKHKGKETSVDARQLITVISRD